MWAIDFQADHLEYGTGFKIISIIDEHTPVIFDDAVDESITDGYLVGILKRLSTAHNSPVFLRMDNGPELTCRALATWAKGIVNLAFISPGERWKNGYVELTHSRKRDQFLKNNTFPSLLHARIKPTDWHREYNNIRRHSRLGPQTPSQYAEDCTCTKTH